MIRICAGTIPLLGLALSLAGCAGAGFTPGSAPVPSSGELQLRAKTRLVYVSDVLQAVVYAFPSSERAQNPPPVETIPVGSTPQGLWVDRKGILYVAAGASVLEFKPGATTPFRTMTHGVVDAVTVAVDRGGTLYVANDQGKNVLIGEYPPGATKPSLTITISLNSIKGFAGGMTFDASGNLYIATFFYRKGAHVFRFASGSTHGTDLDLSVVGGTDGLSMDANGNLYVGDGGAIYVYAPGTKTPSRMIAGSSTQPSIFAMTRSGAIYAPISGTQPADAQLEEFAPGGSTPRNVISNSFSEPVGAALQAEAF